MNIQRNDKTSPLLKGDVMGDRGDKMFADDQTSQITPRADIPPAMTLTDSAISVTPTSSLAQKVDLSETQTNYINTLNSSKSKNESGMENLLNNVPAIKTGIFGNFFNGTTAMVAGIVGGIVVILVLLFFAIFKFKNKDDNGYRKGHKTPNSNGRPVGNNHLNGSVPNKKKRSRKKTENNKIVEKEYFV